MLAGAEVIFARAHEGGPKKSRAAAEHAAHIQVPPRAVDFHLAVVVRALVNQHRLLVLSLLLRDILLAPLKEQNFLARPSTSVSQGRPAGAAADDNQISIVWHRS